MRSLRLTLVAALALGACDGSGDSGPFNEPLGPLSEAPAFAVRSSDFESTSFALLDAEGEPLSEAWITSGAIPVGLSTAIHSDNDLPTVNAADGSLSIIDRMGADRITRFAMPSGELVGQMKTQGSEASSAFASNPYDVVFLDVARALVSRYGHNTMAGVDPIDQGSDLLEFDPQTMTLTGERVDLSSFATSVEYDPGEGPVTLRVNASPAHMLVTDNGFIVVGLERLSAGFEAAAPGLAAIVDSEDYSVDSFDLSPLTNCGVVLPVPGAPNDVAIRCLGYRDPSAAGLVLLRVGDDGAVTERARVTAEDTAELGNVTGAALMLSEDRFVGVVTGGWDDPTNPDVVYLVELSGEEVFATEVHRTAQGYDIFGAMAYREDSGLVLIPSRSEGLHRFDYSGGELGYLDTLSIAPSALPVVSVHRLD